MASKAEPTNCGEKDVDVVEIAASDLDDPKAMKRHLKWISVKLRRR